MQRKIALAAFLAGAFLPGASERVALAHDAEDWPTHYRFDNGTDVGISGNYEGDLNAFSGTSNLSATQRGALQDIHGARREELSVDIRKPGVYEAQWGWDYWNKTFVDVYARVDSKAFLGADYGRLRVGYFKTYVGFEGYTRSRNDSFLETALPVAAFYEGRRSGVSWEFERAAWRADLAAYAGQDLQGDNDGTTFTARLAWTPITGAGRALHLGVTASAEDPASSIVNGRGQTIVPSLRIRARPDVFLTSTRFVDTGTLTHVDRIERRGLEGVWIRGPWSVQGEYLEQDVHRNAGKPDVHGAGGYIFGSWLVSGESRLYENGNVVNPKPAHAWGAMELLVRYDAVDLEDIGADVHGGKEYNWTLGVNWYVLTHFRIQANWIRVHEQGNTAFNTGKTIEPRIFGVRAQIVF